MNTAELIEKINKKIMIYQKDYTLSEVQLTENEATKDNTVSYDMRHTKSISGILKQEHLVNTVSKGFGPRVKKSFKNWSTRPRGTEACHIIGRCLGGTNGVRNAFIGTEKLNRKIMWPIEEIMLEEMPLPAFYKVNLIYEEDEGFCSYVEITIAPLQNISKTSDSLVSGVKVKIKNI